MNEAFKTDGVVNERGEIQANGLPFGSGQKVELVVWPAGGRDTQSNLDAEEIAKRLASLDELDKWFEENRPKNLPNLSDEALCRKSIYMDRGP